MNRALTPDEQLDRIVALAMAEDAGTGDITTAALVPPALTGRGTLRAKASGVLAGLEAARRVFLKVDGSLEFTPLREDGSHLEPGDIIATVRGSISSILLAERTALNFLQHLSGVATLTARYVAAVSGTRARLVDTRKTTPGMRLLEKAAVRSGGGHNHRLHLGDGVLIKDNHLAAARAQGLGLGEVVRRAKQQARGLPVEVEVSSAEQAKEAAEAGADIIMLDNMTPAEMKLATSQLPPGVQTEASGGVTLENIRAIAAAGVDIISVGALTHSAPALDINLKLEPEAFSLP